LSPELLLIAWDIKPSSSFKLPNAFTFEEKNTSMHNQDRVALSLEIIIIIRAKKNFNYDKAFLVKKPKEQKNRNNSRLKGF
jgi:hypothetical protein